MSQPELTEEFLAKVAGWEVVKNARAALIGDRVLSSDWSPPILKGIVQEGPTSYRAGLVIKDAIDVENLCTCRASKHWGSMCVHSIAVGLHHLQRLKPAAAIPKPVAPAAAPKPAKPSRAIRRDADGEALSIHVVLPPNIKEALARGKVMCVLEGEWSKGRVPLNSIPLDKPFAVAPEDAKFWTPRNNWLAGILRGC
jgi:hypothetical protein